MATDNQRTAWTAEEAMACALCWAEFRHPEEREDTPERYWLSITEQAREKIRNITATQNVLRVACGQAVAVPDPTFISVDQLKLFARGGRISSLSYKRLREIIVALRAALRAPSEDYAHGK